MLFLSLPLLSAYTVGNADLRPLNPPLLATSKAADLATDMLAQVNRLRAKGCRCGSTYYPPVPALRWDDRLAGAAQRHTNDMSRHRFFSHTGSDGSDVARRVTRAGFHWRAVAENIAYGYPSVSAVVEGWRKSPGHCRNMMSKDYTHMGGAKTGTFWGQAFARPMKAD